MTNVETVEQFLLGAEGLFSAKDIAEQTGLPVGDVRAAAKELVGVGLIKETKKGKGAALYGADDADEPEDADAPEVGAEVTVEPVEQKKVPRKATSAHAFAVLAATADGVDATRKVVLDLPERLRGAAIAKAMTKCMAKGQAHNLLASLLDEFPPMAGAGGGRVKRGVYKITPMKAGSSTLKTSFPIPDALEAEAGQFLHVSVVTLDGERVLVCRVRDGGAQ